MVQYYMFDGQSALGPFSPPEMKQRGLTAETLVHPLGGNAWGAAGTVEELRAYFNDSHTPNVAQGSPAGPDYYAILGVPSSATAADIKGAFRTKCHECHPDHGGSEEKMRAVIVAYEVLGNAETRTQYDMERQKAPAGSVDETETSQSTPSSRTYQYPKSASNLDDWLRVVADDIRQAEYTTDAHGNPKIINSVTGRLCAWLGSTAVFVVALLVAAAIMRSVVPERGAFGHDNAIKVGSKLAGPIGFVLTGLGAAIGVAVHRWLKNQFALPMQLVGPANKETPSPGAPTGAVRQVASGVTVTKYTTVISCQNCGQKLRVPGDVAIRVHCKACGAYFDKQPGSGPG